MSAIAPGRSRRTSSRDEPPVWTWKVWRRMPPTRRPGHRPRAGRRARTPRSTPASRPALPLREAIRALAAAEMHRAVVRLLLDRARHHHIGLTDGILHQRVVLSGAGRQAPAPVQHALGERDQEYREGEDQDPAHGGRLTTSFGNRG